MELLSTMFALIGILSFACGATYFTLNTWEICTTIGKVLLSIGYIIALTIPAYLFIKSNYNQTLCNL
nr:MAG TPA: hypothetical protein [Crassvirales sp.]